MRVESKCLVAKLRPEFEISDDDDMFLRTFALSHCEFAQ